MTGFTPAQQQAIRERGNVLVVAGAGTGKTSTLVQRCVSLLVEENCSLDEILMVTFTEAAAAQMRARIRAELFGLQGSLAEGTAEASQVLKQLALLDTAAICTLHSFCLQLVRCHFYQLGIDPAILVLDERQTAPLISQTLDALLNRYYAADNEEAVAVQEMIRELGGGSDERIRHRLLRLHRYTQALDDPGAWLDQQESVYQQEEPGAWRGWLEAGFVDWQRDWLPELRLHAGVPAVDLCLQALEEVRGQPSVEQIRASARRLSEADGNEDNWPRGTKTKTRKALHGFFGEVAFLDSTLASQGGRDGLEEDWGWVRPHIRTLLRLAREFTEAFSRAKRELGGVDFSDLEQFALRLLRDPAIARQWQRRLKFIFVDECQDINRAQDAIVRALSREGAQANRFLVGDVKQSIYRFRLANPKIFGEYEEAWREAGPAGTRIPLAENFRSREALLHFINPLFAALMRPEIGGVSYAQDVHLRFGGGKERRHLSIEGSGAPKGSSGWESVPAPRVELHLLDQAETVGEEAPSGEGQPEAQAALLDLLSIEREARLAGLRLRELREEGHTIWDQEQERFRAVEWRDLVVLMRSPSSKIEAFAKEFHQLGIPLTAARGGFYESSEISDLLGVLKLIDNPLQDVPLLAVLRSPLVGLSLDDLVEVRAHNREKPFWAALRKFHRAGRASAAVGEPGSVDTAQAGAWRKTGVFLGQFERWRELARQGSLSHCLDAVLTETDYEALLLAESRGEERLANVHRLLELAQEYDPYQRQGLYRFLRFIESQEEAEIELEPASAQTENAVRLMSIHKSKGLEFPVVVLAGLGATFNFQDLRQDLLLHETYGLCPKVKPPGGEQSYPSVAYWLARRDEHRELLGEEMRLLYVALTRARDTLILTGTCRGSRWTAEAAAAAGETLTSGEARPATRDGAPGRAAAHATEAEGQLSNREVLSGRSYLDWLGLWLPRVTAAGDWTDPRRGQTSLFSWKTYAANDPRLLVEEGVEKDLEPEVSGELDAVELLRLREGLLWRYPFAQATVEPAVKRVSALVWDRVEAGADSQLLFPYEAEPSDRKRSGSRKRPAGKLAAVDIGSAHHRFLELADLARVSRVEDLRKQAGEMIEQGALSADEVAALRFNELQAFWQSEVGAGILTHSAAAAVQREIPLTARFSPEDFASLGLEANAPTLAGEYYVVRGKADLAVLLPSEIWLLDFKTDDVGEADLEARVRLYAPQVHLYALALSRIYRRPVTRRWLHFLTPRRTIELPR